MACAQSFDRILSEARIRLPGAIDDVMKLELFGVLDEFFRRTMLWQETIRLGVITTKQTYDLSSNEWIATINELIYVMNKDAIPVNASMPVAGELYLYSYPAEDQTYTVRVALALADALDDDGCPQVPQWIITKYHEAFKDGLMARMVLQPAKPYFNKDLSLYHGARFRSAMTAAFADMKQQNTFDTQAWRFPQTFATSRRQ
jgi:hypothetical protein